MKPILSLITFALIIAAYGQNCDEAAVKNVPGSWVPGMKGSLGISGNDLSKAQNVTALVDQMMRPDFPVPNGIVATYSTAYSSNNPYIGNDLAQYNYTDWFNHFMCYDGKIRMNPDSQIILRITFNDPDVVFAHDVLPGEWNENEKDRFGWLDNFPAQENGIIYMKATPDSAQFTQKPDRWLLTYEGQLPYRYVTRSEYLQRLKTKLESSIRTGVEEVKSNTPIRPKAEQEIEKQQQLDKFKKEAAQGLGDWTDRYLQGYRTDEQIQEANINAVTEMYQIPLDRVNGELGKPESELQKTAIVTLNGEFNGFLNEGDVGAVILVKENPDYYDPKLQKAVPQLIFVSLTRYGSGDQNKYASVHKNLMARLDLRKLQAMIGK